MADEGKKEDKEKKEGEAAAEENPEQEAKKRKRKLLIMAILGMLLIGGAGAGTFIFLSGGAKTKAEGESEITAKGGTEKTDDKSAGTDKKDEGKKEEGKKDEKHGDEKKGNEHGDEKKADGHAAPEATAGEADKKVDAATGEKKDTKPALDIDFGDTLKMSTFNINLGNALENRYVRIEISLEYKGGEATRQELDKRMPQLRDAIIGILQRKTREFLLAPDGKEALRKEILTRINRYMKSKIEAVYITDMLIE